MAHPSPEALAEDENPDPVRAVAARVTNVAEEPQPGQVAKPAAKEAATGAPKAGRSGVDEALHNGPKGVLQLLGPGLITGASDDDPSGIATYSQAGAQFGLGTLWLALFQLPMMIAIQEMCARIGLVTGSGLAGIIKKRYSKKTVYPIISLLLVANTINIG